MFFFISFILSCTDNDDKKIINDTPAEVTLQQRLDNGETPYQIYLSNNSLLNSLYGLHYQGGIIFYLNTSNGTGLISSEINQSYQGSEVMHWGCETLDISASENSSIGFGQANTSAVVTNCSQLDTAASVCDFLILNGYSDWYLPSKDELNLMYQNLDLNGFGDFKNNTTVHIGSSIYFSAYYWSSTQSSTDIDKAWVQSFENGLQLDFEVGFKSFYHMVRAVRNF
ncbi:Protein of unknown function [Flavobacterium swingsii]|uniref:Lcl C-terminal domain-containing protein n=2 Tax=Flavobacterium swingsii TaxID=498292 RepID=A0A1I0UYX1_9FLAO|nr:Protein of unknown function [Flavobacterium swingsii]